MPAGTFRQREAIPANRPKLVLHVTISPATVGSMRWWIRSLAVGAAVGFAVGLIVGGTLGRVFMRVLFLAKHDTLGIETAMGAIIGDFTAGGTLFICAFGAGMGILLGLSYVCVRALMPARIRWRATIFVVAATGLMLARMINDNREDFAVVPVTLSIFLMVGAVVVTATPVPLLVERFAPDRERRPGPVANAAVGIGVLAIVAYAATAVASVYG